MNCRTVFMMGCLAAWPVAADAQDLASLINNTPDGYVRISFAARPDVCEDGWQRGRNSDEHWEPVDTCANGPVRVQLRKADGDVFAIRVYVGGSWRASVAETTDLGPVSASAAAAYFMGLVRTASVAHRAIYPATLADSSEIWQQLLQFAQDTSLPNRTNKEAMNWLGITAGRLFRDDEALDDDSEARRRALFSVTQLPADEGIPRLIQISETHRFEYLRRLAVFWLGQSGDHRALQLMERVFRTRG